jgi:hypothetical protein
VARPWVLLQRPTETDSEETFRATSHRAVTVCLRGRQTGRGLGGDQETPLRRLTAPNRPEMAAPIGGPQCSRPLRKRRDGRERHDSRPTPVRDAKPQICKSIAIEGLLLCAWAAPIRRGLPLTKFRSPHARAGDAPLSSEKSAAKLMRSSACVRRERDTRQQMRAWCCTQTHRRRQLVW